jgi:hypothetical protein
MVMTVSSSLEIGSARYVASSMASSTAELQDQQGGLPDVAVVDHSGHFSAGGNFAAKRSAAFWRSGMDRAAVIAETISCWPSDRHTIPKPRHN